MHYSKSDCYGQEHREHGCKGAAFFGHYGKHFGHFGKHGRFNAPVNIKENAEDFEVHLYAAGFKKSDFEIGLSGSVMTITVKRTAQEEGSNWLRKEYQPNVIERRFELGDKIDAAGITAKYEEGVLIVRLPKKEADTPSKNVTVE